MCFEGKWLQNRLRADNNESRSLLAVDIQGHQRGGFCIRRSISSSLHLSFKCALRESGCRIGYEPTTMNRDHFWRLISRDTNVEVSALSPLHSINSHREQCRCMCTWEGLITSVSPGAPRSLAWLRVRETPWSILLILKFVRWKE